MDEYYLNKKQLAAAISETDLGALDENGELISIYDYWPSEYCDAYEPWNEGGFRGHKVYFQEDVPYVILATGERRYFRGQAYRDTYIFDIAEYAEFNELLGEALFPDEFTGNLFAEERYLRHRLSTAYRGLKLRENDIIGLRATLISLEEMIRACESNGLIK